MCVIFSTILIIIIIIIVIIIAIICIIVYLIIIVIITIIYYYSPRRWPGLLPPSLRRRGQGRENTKRNIKQTLRRDAACTKTRKYTKAIKEDTLLYLLVI